MEASEYERISLLKEEKFRKIYYDHLESARVYDSDDDDEESDDDDEEHDKEDDASNDETGDEESSENETRDENEVHHIAGDHAQLHHQGQEEKSIRGPTDMKKFWAKHGPNNKVQLQFNHLGQPCGVKTSKLSNFMSSLVKGKDVSLGANTWRDVPDCEKNKLWMTLKEMSAVNKATRENQNNARHTAGTRSFAVVHEQEVGFLVLEIKQGQPVSRSQLYRIVHTNKDGLPVDDYSAAKIEEITVAFHVKPSLIREEHREGDLYSQIFPNPSKSRMHEFGLVVGGKSSVLLSEVVSAFRDSKEENLQLRGLLETLLASQAALTERSQLIEDKLNSFIATQELKSTSTAQEEATIAKEMLPETEQVEATEGAAAASIKRGANQLKLAVEASQGGKYSQQTNATSQLLGKHLKNSFVPTQDLENTFTLAEEEYSGKKMLTGTEQVPTTEGVAAASIKRCRQVAEANKDEAIRGGKHLKQKEESIRGAKHLKQAAQASQGGKYSHQTNAASQLLGKHLKHSIVPTQDLENTFTLAEEEYSGKKMLTDTEQVPATEGAAASSIKRCRQAAEANKDEAIRGGKHLKQKEESIRGAKHLKQAVETSQGGKYLQQANAASQPKQTVKESIEKSNKAGLNKRRAVEAKGPTEITESSQVRGTATSIQYMESSKATTKEATTLPKKKKRSAADCFKSTTTDCLKITTKAYTQVDETSQEARVPPKTEKLQNIIDSQVGELQCVVAPDCAKPKPKTSYKKLLEGCEELIKVKEEKVEEIITSKKQKAWFPPRKAMKLTELELDSINREVVRKVEKELWENDPRDVKCKKRRSSKPQGTNVT
ncbi:hypothetical protein QYE76_003163 [Lolium multiflorum]|uniref:Uncharacterized protein n=1 Tax=Lolium multiflorum TaxID=4521 RepID=A0AAD8W113_LOLMU|nr:hypothetical protein QYE76_003163 [Lolium multiflorum]